MTPSTAMALKNLMMVDRHSNQQKLGHIMMIQDFSLITKLIDLSQVIQLLLLLKLVLLFFLYSSAHLSMKNIESRFVIFVFLSGLS